MPSPFSNKPKTEQPVAPATGARVELICVQGEFWCEFCFDVSVMAEYEAKTKRLTWECRNCGKDNIVRNIDL